MGKDSLIKSTTKKAGTKKEKKTSKKKSAAKAVGAKTKKEAPAKAKAPKKTEPLVTLQDLLFRKFSRSLPPEDAPLPKQDLSGMTAPPLITSINPQEVERLRALLEKRFSMEEIAAAAQAPVETPPPAAPKAPVSIEELLFKQFAAPRQWDDSPPPVQDLSEMTAPPFITSTDPQETERLQTLLARRFSMEEIAAAAQAPVETPPPAAPKAPVSIEELLFKQFAAPRQWDDSPPPAQDLSEMTAPPFITSTDPQEMERLQTLLARRFSMEEIAAAAQAPVETPPPVAEAEPLPPAEEPEATPPVPEAPVQAEAASPTEPEPMQAAPPAQPSEAQVTEPPAPEAAPDEAPAASAPEIQAVATPPVEATAPAPAPALEQPEQKKQAPATPSVVPAPAAPQPVMATPPPKEESRVQPTPAKAQPAPADSGWRSIKLGIAAVLTIFLLIMWGSFNNSGKYFVIPKKGAIEIWRGTFSPTGKTFVAVLHGVEPAAAIKSSYGRAEIYPILCDYYIGKADALLDVSGLPDYKAIGDYLQRAREYALSKEVRAAVQTRMDNIHRLSLTYKAEIDISKGTIPSLQSALQALKEVQELTTEPSQVEALSQRITAVRASLSALEAKTPEGNAGANPEKAEQGAPKEAKQASPEK